MSACSLKRFDELFLQQAKSLEHVAQRKHSGSLLSLRQEGESELSLWVYGDGGLLGGGGRSGGLTEWRRGGVARSGEVGSGGRGDGGGNGGWVGRPSPLRVSASDTSVFNSEDGTVVLVVMMWLLPLCLINRQSDSLGCRTRRARWSRAAPNCR